MSNLNLIFQPAGGHGTGRYSRKHYENTIARSFSLEEINNLGLLTKYEYDSLRSIYPDGKLYAWAIRSTHPNGKPNNSNCEKFKSFKSGDISLFVDNRIVKSIATVTFTTRNKELGKYLWDESKYNSITDSDQSVYDLIYFVDNVKRTNIELYKIGAYLDWDKNYSLSGWQFVNGPIVDTIIDKFNFDNNVITVTEYKKAIEYLNKHPLDKETKTNARIEQTFLRKYLFKDHKVCKCGICGKIYPVDMLVTSHIKKRSECTYDEKSDFENIVMPMCSCGCDKAFEEGYIYVDDNGIIRFNEDKKSFCGDLYNHFKPIINTKCSYFNERTRKYFAARRKSLNIK